MVVGSNPTLRTLAQLAHLVEQRKMYPVVFCPGDGTGIRVSLKRRILRVRIPPGAPSLCSHSIMVLHTLGKGETQVQFLLGAPKKFLTRL